MRSAPTQDRILLGIVAGAAAGSLALTLMLGLMGYAERLGVLVPFLTFLFFLLYLPPVFAPLWWGARLLRLPEWLAAATAGAAALLASPAVLSLILRQRLPDLSEWQVDTPGPTWLDYSFMPAVGAVIGLVAWCVARWDIDASK